MILDRYILRQLAAAFLLTFAAVSAVSLIILVFQTLRIVSGMGLILLVKVVPVALTYMAPWALAVATCAATTLVYGRLAAENEINAMVTSGIHPWRVFLPGLLFALFLSGISYFIHEYAAPKAHYEKRSKLRESILFVLQAPPPGNQTFKIEDRYLLSYVNFQDGLMELPLLLEREITEKKEEILIESFAKSGRITFDEQGIPTILLINGEMWRTTPHDRSRVNFEGDVPIRLNRLQALAARPKQAADMTSQELLEIAGRTTESGKYLDAMTEYHVRKSKTLSPLFLTLLSAAIGMLVRRNSRLAGLGAAAPPFLLYIILGMLGDGLGTSGKMPALAAAWMPNAALALAALPLLGRVLFR